MKPFFIELKSTKRFKRLLNKDGQRLKAGLVMLKQGESIGLHSTEGKKECIIILKGKAKIYYGKRNVFTLKEEPTFIFLPQHTLHNVENIGKGLLKYVYITISNPQVKT